MKDQVPSAPRFHNFFHPNRLCNSNHMTWQMQLFVNIYFQLGINSRREERSFLKRFGLSQWVLFNIYFTICLKRKDINSGANDDDDDGMLMQETNLDQIMHRQCHRLTIFLYLIWQIVTQSGTIVRRAGLSNYALHCFCDVKVHFTEISWHRNVNIFFGIFYLPQTILQSKAFNV